MYRLIRRGSALLIAVAIVVLIVYDVMNGRGFSDWWDEHAITTSLVSDLLIVGATALIFNEVQAYRQRKERSVTVAAQGLIVYSQAREAYQAVMASVSDPSSDDGIPDELRDLASNLLVASPSLFDDPDARNFLLELDRLMAWLFAAANGRSSRPGGPGQTGHLTDQMNQVQAAFQPLVARFPAEYQARVRGADTDTDSVTGSDGSDGGARPPARPA
ncbi:MAG TPA: hypothetical protein VGJ19_08880 [Streptosporangiaceae bacterium]